MLIKTLSVRARARVARALVGKANVALLVALLGLGGVSHAVEPVPAPKPAAAAATAALDALDDKQKLSIGDRLSFRILEDKEEPKSITVSDTGELEIPYIGRVSAAEKTCQLLAREIKAELEKRYYYKATVIVAVDLFSRNRGKVYLVGQVRASGPQEIPSDEVLTLTKAILRSGGFTDFADKKHVKVTRKKTDGKEQESFTVDVSEIIEKGKLDKDLNLQAGDLVFVPARLVNF